jgi:hypothetical protein
MPKATRAKDENEAPKKRSRKAKPADGNGTDAAEPVTTAPAIAATTSEVTVGNEAPKKRTSKAKPVNGNAIETIEPVTMEPVVVKTAPKPSITEKPVVSGNHNGHTLEELVRRRAYELYLERRGQGGSPEQDWFRALQEVRGQHVA